MKFFRLALAGLSFALGLGLLVSIEAPRPLSAHDRVCRALTTNECFLTKLWAPTHQDGSWAKIDREIHLFEFGEAKTPLGLRIAQVGQIPAWPPIQVVSSASYQGPGNIVSGATAWGSCARVYTAALASTSTSLCDINAKTGGAAVCTLRGTASGFVDLAASYCAGTTPALACAAASGGSCVVSKVYDQSGNSNHFTQATAANMPPLTFSALGGLPGLTNNNVNAVLLQSPAITLSQPITYTAVSERNANFTTVQRIIVPITTLMPRFSYNSATSQMALNATNTLTATATDSAFHAFSAIANGTVNSAIVVDGVATTGNAGTSGLTTAVDILSDGVSQPLNGFIMEIGIWGVAFNSTQYGNMNTNIHSATNGYNF